MKLLNFSSNILVTVILTLIALVTLFITLVVLVGIGYLLSLLFPFSLFQATVLVTGSTFLITFLILSTIFHSKLDEIKNSLMEDEDEEEEQNDENEQLRRKIAFLKSMKVGRNDPCPCGSGKKAKYCCMQLQ